MDSQVGMQTKGLDSPLVVDSQEVTADGVIPSPTMAHSFALALQNHFSSLDGLDIADKVSQLFRLQLLTLIMSIYLLKIMLYLNFGRIIVRRRRIPVIQGRILFAPLENQGNHLKGLINKKNC